MARGGGSLWIRTWQRVRSENPGHKALPARCSRPSRMVAWWSARRGDPGLGAEGLPATVLQKQHWELLKDMLKEGMFSPLAAAGPSAPLPSLGSVGFGRSARAAGGRGWRSPGSGRRTGSWLWAAGMRCLCRAALQEVRGVIRRKWDWWHWGAGSCLGYLQQCLQRPARL